MKGQIPIRQHKASRKLSEGADGSSSLGDGGPLGPLSPSQAEASHLYFNFFHEQPDLSTIGSFNDSASHRLSLDDDAKKPQALPSMPQILRNPGDADGDSIFKSIDDDMLEPYPLVPKPSKEDQKMRKEALQAFLELAAARNLIPRKGMSMRKSNPQEESQNLVASAVSSSSASSSAETQDDLRAKQLERVGNIMNVDYASVPRIRDYQEQQWEDHFKDLVEFQRREGHCCVPHAYEENPGLARWVKRQRYQYKLRQKGEPKSTMVPHRMKALEKLGFVWDSHAALWEERLNELKVFRMMYNHCDVPSVFPANPQLATWVKCQRRQYKAYLAGRSSTMSQSRLARLNEIGFDWKMRVTIQQHAPAPAPEETTSGDADFQSDEDDDMDDDTHHAAV